MPCWRRHRLALLCAAAMCACLPSLEEGGAAEEDSATSGTIPAASLSGSSANPSSTTSGSATSGGPSTTAPPSTTRDPTASTTATDPTTTSESTSSAEGSGTSGDGEESTSTGTADASRRVFLSSQTFTGNMGGLAGADAACQELAGGASLGGDWMAYIVDENLDLSRHAQGGGPFVKLDGTEIAADWGDLNDGSIASALDLTETRTTPGGNVWTGFRDVVGVGDNWCQEWTFSSDGCLAGAPCGSGGQSNATNGAWDGSHVYHCSSAFRLYCIEQ